ncbi:bifunctional DNA primase/polymerase [Bradyrhizobium diazoefficiens]
MSNANGTLKSALRLAGAGYPVFPIAVSKRPTCPHAFKDATTDPMGVRQLWRDHPGPLLGVPTGKVTDLLVLDLDITKHTAAAEWFERHAPYLPETRQQTTRSGGLHLFFRHVEGVRNSAGRIALGVDIRAEGGSIIVWQPEAWLDGPRPLAEAPEWLLDMAKPKPSPPPPAFDRAAISQSAALRKIEGIVAAVATGKPGQRNAIAYWGASRLAELVNQAVITQGDAIALAVEAARQAGLSSQEAQRTVASAFRGAR